MVISLLLIQALLADRARNTLSVWRGGIRYIIITILTNLISYLLASWTISSYVTKLSEHYWSNMFTTCLPYLCALTTLERPPYCGAFPLTHQWSSRSQERFWSYLQAQGKECWDLLVMTVKDRQIGSVEHFPQPGKPNMRFQGSGGCVVLRKR